MCGLLAYCEMPYAIALCNLQDTMTTEFCSPTQLPSFPANEKTTPTHLHRALALFNRQRLTPGMPINDWQDQLQQAMQMQLVEGDYIESLRHAIKPLLPHKLPAVQFVQWFESLLLDGPGQQHPLFDWLAEQANTDQMRWFLTQEAAGEAGFEDLLALTQVRLPPRAKLECARNFWDEMGHGKETAMHGRLLEQMVTGLQLQPRVDDTVWESLALNNAMLAMALNRRYCYQSLGALGVIELTAPSRVKKIAAGMQRLGFASSTRAYFNLHGALDVAHARAWLAEVITPLVQDEPASAIYLAEGALLRLLCGERCFDRFQHELGVSEAEMKNVETADCDAC